MAEREHVNWTEADGVATVTVDNTPLNLLSKAVHLELAACLDELETADSVRVLIITGAGERAFSAGSDVKEFATEMHPGGGRERALREFHLFNKISFMRKPSIAAITRLAMGGGLELAMACDMRVAEEGSRLALPEIKLGAFPGACTVRLPRLVGAAKAKEIMFLGEPITAQEALRIGLVNRIAPPGQALQTAREMAARIAAHPGEVVGIIKDAVDRGLDLPLAETGSLVADGMEQSFLSENIREGVQAFLDKRPPRFKHR